MQLDGRDMQIFQKDVDIGTHGDNPTINATQLTNK
jgi:hypothetical protein